MLKMRAIKTPIFVILLNLLLGCTSQATYQAMRAEMQQFQKVAAPLVGLEGYRDYRGAVHVHSEISHDSRGTSEEIIAGAKEAAVDFILMSDHVSTKIFSEGMEGWSDEVLVIRGMEVDGPCLKRADQCSSLLAIGIEEYFDPNSMSLSEVIDEIDYQGGLAIVAHPAGWSDWDNEVLVGMEIYDVLDDAVDRPFSLIKHYLDVWNSYEQYPEQVVLGILDHPSAHLERWDRMTAKRPFTALAGNDAHQNTKLAGHQVDPYSLSFRFVSTHLLARELDEISVLDAIRSGHTYVAFELFADAKGFMFSVDDHEKVTIMGDQTYFWPGMKLAVRTPVPGKVVIFRDGVAVEECTCSKLSYAVPERGVYRVEVSLMVQERWRPWIFSNPIYIR